jgi:hypothetical protein
MNTANITSASSNILLVGDSGTHKTWFLGDIPGLFVFDFDRGMTVLRGRDIEYDIFKEAPRGVKVSKEQTARDGLYPWAEAWAAFTLRLNQLGAEIDVGRGPKAIALDSLTFMSDIALTKVLKDTDQTLPHQGTWGAQQQYLMTVLNQLTAWPVQLVCTAHLQRTDNDLTGVVEKLPLLTGKLAGRISAYFDEVYFCDSTVDAAGVQKFTVKTKATPVMRQAKSRWGVPDGTETSWGAVSKFYNAAAVPPTPKAVLPPARKS